MKLKPCPFCGFSEIKLEKYHNNEGYTIIIHCPNCHIETQSYRSKEYTNPEKEAVKAWNCRTYFPHWVPIEEHLPPPLQDILITDIDDQVYMGSRYHGSWYRDDNHEVGKTDKHIKAWMSPPDPYQNPKNHKLDTTGVYKVHCTNKNPNSKPNTITHWILAPSPEEAKRLVIQERLSEPFKWNIEAPSLIDNGS